MLLRTTNRVDFFRFSFQQYTYVNYTIKPGDRINTHCHYDSSQRTEPTEFDDGSEDEMCMEFITYYPALYIEGKAYSMCGYVHYMGAEASLCGNTRVLSSRKFFFFLIFVYFYQISSRWFDLLSPRSRFYRTIIVTSHKI